MKLAAGRDWLRGDQHWRRSRQGRCIAKITGMRAKTCSRRLVRRDRGRGEGIHGRKRHAGAAEGNGMGNRGLAGRATLSKGRVSTDSRVLFMVVSFVHMYVAIRERVQNGCVLAYGGLLSSSLYHLLHSRSFASPWDSAFGTQVR